MGHLTSSHPQPQQGLNPVSWRAPDRLYEQQEDVVNLLSFQEEYSHDQIILSTFDA